MKRLIWSLSILSCLAGPHVQAEPTTLLSADFNADESGFDYRDDPFLGTNLPDYAAGTRVATGGYEETGALQVLLGGFSMSQSVGASGGWRHSMKLAAAVSGVAISFRYKLRIGASHAYDEYSRVLVALDGNLLGRGAKTYVDHLGGSGTGAVQGHVFHPTTDWQRVVIPVGEVPAGLHQWEIGAYNNKSGAADAKTALLIDDVVVTGDNPPGVASAPRILVDRLDLDRFKANIQTLASFGDRYRRSQRFRDAQTWVAGQLSALGYKVEYHATEYSSHPVSNLYVTKVGTSRPDQMYIVSAHLDGTGGGGAADDDGSGVSLLLEIARVLAATDVATGISIRLIFWDYEEYNAHGSRAYVLERRGLQGLESPPGSGSYPEPTWLGMLQHDMLLYDHGIRPPSAEQSPFADLDVEWYFAAAKSAESRALALLWHHWSGEYATRFPSTAYDRSGGTDDTSFEDEVAVVSIRENRRSDFDEYANPNWHEATDLYEAYSADDFELGFNAVQATLGTVATLAHARIVNVDGIFRDGFETGPAPGVRSGKH